MCERQRVDLMLTGKIAAIHRRSRGAYGSPNIHAELADEHGIRVGRKRVARLMRDAGLKGASLRRYVVTTQADSQAEKAIDLVQRRFYATAPDRLWVADITYIPTWSGFLYLAMVLDVYSRKIVGWAMETHRKRVANPHCRIAAECHFERVARWRWISGRTSSVMVPEAMKSASAASSRCRSSRTVSLGRPTSETRAFLPWAASAARRIGGISPIVI